MFTTPPMAELTKRCSPDPKQQSVRPASRTTHQAIRPSNADLSKKVKYFAEALDMAENRVNCGVSGPSEP